MGKHVWKEYNSRSTIHEGVQFNFGCMVQSSMGWKWGGKCQNGVSDDSKMPSF